MAHQTTDSFPSPRSTVPDPWDVVAACAPHLCIAHQSAGRVRLRLLAPGIDAAAVRRADLERLHAAFRAMPGVRELRINPLARSCLIAYDRELIPDTAWPDLFAQRRTPAALALLGLLHTAARACGLSPTPKGDVS